ncbi:MAG: hypothetical protein JNK02_09150 [Planctomycetes bacterium]|nr:hypothetical protein [Planctomycetota bacterium]
MPGPGPQILSVELALDAVRVERAPWSSADPLEDFVGRCGGSATALAVVRSEARRSAGAASAPAPLVIAAGEGVLRGLPTAARACVASRAPLTASYADGQVGGLLGPHVAALAGAITVRGRVAGRDLVLVVDARGGARIERVDGLTALDLRARRARLAARFPRHALLATGPAGDARIPFASLANEADPPSFTGRGGLGALLGELGLVALAVAPPAGSRVADEHGPDGRALRPALLLESARLAARAAGGTFESRSGEVPADPGERKGCRGCPTPCGWVFERAEGAFGARRSAIEALLAPLGLLRFEDALRVLGRCDELGLDAKEAGLALALLAEHGQRLARADERAAARALRGDVAAVLGALDQVVDRSGLGAQLAHGAAALARGLRVDAPLARGSAVRAQNDLASLLGQCVSTRGADPLRTFAFLAADVPDRARLARLVAPWPLPAGAEDPTSPAGKGRLVAWAESFQAAVDASGFCAFSAAALLADGVASLDELARWILPDAARARLGEDGRALLALGASITILQRELACAHGAPDDADRPAFAAAELDRPGMLDEYRRFRGLDARGFPTAAARRVAGTRAVLDLHGTDEHVDPGTDRAVAAERVAVAPVAVAPGLVVLRAAGPLGAVLQAPCPVELALPATLADVLEAAARARPAARGWLVRDGIPLPTATRASVRLQGADLVQDGDALDLVLALSGG